MANKINAKLILELKASGLSRNQIAATRHMSKHSVSDVINIAREKDITVFCKYFLDKVAKYFWTLLHVQIGQSCKASAGCV